MRHLILALFLVSACGTVSQDPPSGAAGAGGAAGAAGGSTDASGGRASAAGSGGEAAAGASGGAGDVGGRGGQLEETGGHDGMAGAGGAASGGTAGAAGAPPTCVSNNANGFAFNNTCDGGSPASNGCHANCEISGNHYVGCVAPSSAGQLAFYCYASCSDCPAP